MRRAATILGACLPWLLILFAVAAAVYALAGNGDLLAAEMLRCAPPEASGLPAAEYPGVGRMTAAFLTGARPSFQYTFEAAGSTYLCFQPHEAAHMADCRELIRLAGTMRWAAGIAALALVCAGLALRRQREHFARGMVIGLRIAGVALLGVLAWALIDFDGLFTAFHRLAFTNDGWLLDPRTDLLIRLMPTEFFTSLGTRVLFVVLGAALAADLAARIALRRRKTARKEQEP